LVVGGGRALGAEPEQGLEGGHGCPAAGVTKGERVQIDLQVLAADVAAGALQPGLGLEIERCTRGNSHSPVAAWRWLDRRCS
jgi:hypothetical protein